MEGPVGERINETQMYHLTGHKEKTDIVENGKIEPYSKPFWKRNLHQGDDREILTELGVDFTRLQSVMKADQYIVGFAHPRPEGWTRYGLMQFVISHITEGSPWDRYTGGKVYSFEMQVSTAHLYVRDHFYTSPEYYRKIYGKNYWRTDNFDMTDPDCAEGVAKYLQSTKPWTDYEEGEYKAPELWYAGVYYMPDSYGIYELSKQTVEKLGENELP